MPLSNKPKIMFDVKLLSDEMEGGIRKAAFQTCDVVCSLQIDIELDGDTIRSVRYTGGCNGNTQGLSALVAGRKKDEVIALLDGINCKGQQLPRPAGPGAEAVKLSP